jgi:hypothetical protein
MRATSSDGTGPSAAAKQADRTPHGTYTEYATDLEPADGPAGPGFSYKHECGPNRRFVPEALLIDKELDGKCGAQPRYLLTIARNPPRPDIIW